MKRLLLVTVAVILIASGCQYAIGPFHADGGEVACIAASTDAHNQIVPKAHGATAIYSGSCNNGNPLGAGTAVRVRLYHFGEGGARTLCAESGWVTNGTGESNVTIGLPGGGPAVCDNDPGTRWQAESQGRVYSASQGEITSDWKKAPVEELQPGGYPE